MGTLFCLLLYNLTLVHFIVQIAHVHVYSPIAVVGTQRGLICTYVHVAVILKFEFYCKGEMSAYLHMYVLYVHTCSSLVVKVTFYLD